LLIAGAGMAGLVCAARARQLGLSPRVVEPLPHEPLKLLVAAWALAPEVVPLDVAPDDAARQQHRAARTRPLLDDAR